MYKIMCNYGTRKTAWTLNGAMSWLEYCGTAVVIQNRLTGKIVCRRLQGVK